MSQVRFYISTLQLSGQYGDYVDVSSDVSLDSLGKITAKLEGSDYDVGVVTLSSIKIKINNVSGTYSDPSDLRSMFKVERGGSKVRVTWQKGDDDAYCNFAICGESYPYAENTVYEGILSDESATTDLKTNYINFDVLSYSSLLSDKETPIDLLSNGQLVSEVMGILLDEFSDTFTKGDIVPKNDVIIDDVSEFEDTVIDEVISELLKASNSVMYFNIDTVSVSGRSESAELKRTFYGQASSLGIEDVIAISKIKSGLSRTFNFWRWEDTDVVSKDTSSIDKYGSRVNDIDIPSVKVSGTQQSILDNYKDEFKLPLMEFNLDTFMDVTVLQALDKINIDYPTPYYVNDGDTMPYYGRSVYGVARYPFGEYGLTLTVNDYFKIISITIDLKKDVVTYGLRGI